mmetsp:Transcript_12580/g.20970  ORF Transcript_12580/g.20970 Transcript_12580/m.20970 type:complete len:156 (-) Transcript_12580:653-1120(-)
MDQVVNLQPSLRRAGQGTLDTFGFLAQLLDGARVFGDINVGSLLNLLDEVLHDALIKILSSQMRVTVGGKGFKDAVVDVQESDVEGSASEVKDEDISVIQLCVESIGHCRSGRFIDDTRHFESSNLSCVLCGDALRIIEVGWDCNDCFFDWMTKE